MMGELELNRNPEIYFAEVEQVAFEPCNVVMGFSPHKMLQARLISYPDAHRYRLGVNYDSLPVNKPPCPYPTYNKDGAMRFDGNGGSSVNYEPNSCDIPDLGIYGSRIFDVFSPMRINDWVDQVSDKYSKNGCQRP